MKQLRAMPAPVSPPVCAKTSDALRLLAQPGQLTLPPAGVLAHLEPGPLPATLTAPMVPPSWLLWAAGRAPGQPVVLCLRAAEAAGRMAL